MYSTCIFCNNDLGSNEAVEHFPVGRRLAFDVAKGRLWAVCRKCERWNLTPIEERWEAIEECERSFRGTKLRVSTDQIGLGRIKEGLELVRIGKPLRPEFAAWRYGDQFGRRRRRNIVRVGAGVLAGSILPWAGAVTAGTIATLGINAFTLMNLARSLYHWKHIAARLRGEDGELLVLSKRDVAGTLMLPPSDSGDWGLRITHLARAGDKYSWRRIASVTEQTDVRGEAAMRALARLLPVVNQEGATRAQLEDAVRIATRETDPVVEFRRATRIAGRTGKLSGDDPRLTLLPTEIRLALEMTSHEDAERRALEGELKQLEDAWREAEEIASISDDMFLPTEVSEQLAEIKDRAR